MSETTSAFGDILRGWRLKRRLSQLDLAAEADLSTRHLSFLETGRSRPSRETAMHLAETLDLPLRDRNALLVAAGFAPVFGERPLDHPALAAPRRLVDQVLAAHEPYPALAIDRHWNLVTANRAAHRLLTDVDPALLAPPCNVLRLSLDPKGLAPRIRDLAVWRAHVLARLDRQIAVSGDAGLVALAETLKALPMPAAARRPVPPAEPGVAIRLELETPLGTLAFITTTTVFGTPLEVTLAELAIETLLPADEATARALAALAAADRTA